MAAKDFTAAAQLYAQYLQSDSTNTVVLMNYANALANANQLPAAVGVMQKVTRINPEDPQAWGFLAQLYQATGNAAAAQEANGRAESIVAEQREEAGDQE
jgi:predicted Zn-dependent protease